MSVDQDARESSVQRAKTSHWMSSALIRAGWAPAGVFALHLVASRAKLRGLKDGNLYAEFPWIDIPMHFGGGVAIAFFAWRALREASRAGALAALDRAITAMLVFGFTCAAAVFWEFAEYCSDRYFATRAQLGLEDTLGDMFLGITGCGVFLAWIAGRERVSAGS